MQDKIFRLALAPADVLKSPVLLVPALEKEPVSPHYLEDKNWQPLLAPQHHKG